MNILVYNGPGTSVGSVKHTIKSLKSIVSSYYDVIPVDHHMLNQPLAAWMDSTSLIVIPGGRDLPFVKYLHPYGIQHLKRFVENGGNYFGLCAGAYFACQEIDFSLNRYVLYPSSEIKYLDEHKENERIQGKRDLNFFNGIGYGSISSDFVYNSEMGSRAVNLILEKDLQIPMHNLKVYVNGAPYFVENTSNSNSKTNTKVLGWYDLPRPQPALVECQVGNGKAILSGPHIEFDPKDTFASLNQMDEITRSCIQKILPDLLEHDPSRFFLLRCILNRFGLKLNPMNTDLDSVPITPIFLCSMYNSFDSELLLLAHESRVIVDTKDKWKFSLYTLDYHNNTDSINEDLDFKMVLDKNQLKTSHFRISEFFNQLASLPGPHSFGSLVMYGDTVTSTQSILEKNYQLSMYIPHGTVFVASQQISGRGLFYLMYQINSF